MRMIAPYRSTVRANDTPTPTDAKATISNAGNDHKKGAAYNESAGKRSWVRTPDVFEHALR